MKKAIALLLAVITIIAIFPVSSLGAVTNSSGDKVTSITLPTKVTGSESIKTYRVKYNQANLPGKLNGYAGIIIPVKAAKAGYLCIDYDVATLGEYAYVDLYKESSLETRVDFGSIDSDKLSGKITLVVPKAGTYYLTFSSYTSAYSEPFNNNIKIKPYVISKESRTMKAGKWSLAGYNENYTYFKFSVSKSCVVNVYSGSYQVDVQLMNSKKKPIQDYSVYLDNDNNYRTSYFLGKGTYYLRSKGIYDSIYKLKFDTASIATLKEGSFKTFYQADSQLDMYLKFKAVASGYVRISGKHFSGDVTLCNSKRKAISDEEYISSENDYTAVFGVSKGTTYYLRINNGYDYGAIRFTNAKVSDSSGSSKSKAKSMTADKTYKGYIAAGSSTKDWFKFKLTKSRYWAIYLDGGVSDSLKVTIYDKGGKEVVSTYSYYGDKAKVYSYNKWEAGTYYVCISRSTSKSSGYYSMKIKTSSKSLA